VDGAWLISSTLALAVVCALALAALRALGRRGVSDGGGLRVRARLPLETRRTIYVVEADGRRLLIGAGDGPLTLLCELDPAREPAESSADAPWLRVSK
jgi:flagellar protein FliO/FliZ